MIEEKILSCDDEYAKCPICGMNLSWKWYYYGEGTYENNKFLGLFTKCNNCNQIFIALSEKIIYPRITSHIKPHELFAQYTKSSKLFNESLAVASDSPRAGLTLSRMCLECLVHEILIERNEKPSDNFSVNIKKLLELEIITNKIKNLLDDTRVIGNKSTHNFNLIDSENEVVLDDCMVVWKAINHILESLSSVQKLDADITNLKDKVKEK